MRWIDHLSKVRDVEERNIAGTLGESVMDLPRGHFARQDRGHAGCGRKCKKRNLLQKQNTDYGPPACAVATASQWPVIQKQQHERHRDQRRLTHQTQHKEN